MELGALICTPRQPRCEACPLTKQCAARRDDLTEELPNLGKRAPSTARRFVACVLERDGTFLVRQRPAGVVNAHLWEFPNTELALDAGDAGAQRLLEFELGGVLPSLAPFTSVKHTITRYRIQLDVFRGMLCKARLGARAGAGEWIKSSKLHELPFTSAHRKVLLKLLRSEHGPS